MSEKTGEPRKKHHEILTWAHISDSPRKIRMRGDQVGPASLWAGRIWPASRPGALWRRVAPTPPDHLPYMFLAGTDLEDYKRGLPPPLTTHTISYVKEKSREAPPLCILSLGSVRGRSAEKSRTCRSLFGFVPLRIQYIWSTYPGSSNWWVLFKLFFCSHSFAGSSSVLVADTLE